MVSHYLQLAETINDMLQCASTGREEHCKQINMDVNNKMLRKSTLQMYNTEENLLDMFARHQEYTVRAGE